MRKRHGIRFKVSSFLPSNTLPHTPAGEWSHRRAKGSVGLLLEQLRYAGVVSMKEGGDEFTIWQPPEALALMWRDQSIARCLSFGIQCWGVEE